MGPVAPRHVGSSQTRARTRVPCIGRQIPNHCATREAQPLMSFKQGSERIKISSWKITLDIGWRQQPWRQGKWLIGQCNDPDNNPNCLNSRGNGARRKLTEVRRQDVMVIECEEKNDDKEKCVLTHWEWEKRGWDRWQKMNSVWGAYRHPSECQQEVENIGLGQTCAWYIQIWETKR